jgi:hypothetical protein
MAIQKAEDHGVGDIENKYCKYYTDEQGNLKSKEEIIEGWINFAMKSENISREETEKKVDEEMSKMSAWQ